MTDPVEGNRALWDELTPIHVASDFYDIEGFRAGRSSLRHIELVELGEVGGKKLLHLQCHFGMDSLSWARLGAKVTGTDLSSRSIEIARSLADDLGIGARFVCCELYDLPGVLDETFDVVFTSYGALPWLPDIGRWADVVRRFLRPGGAFYMVEFHPVIHAFGDGPQSELAECYFHETNPHPWKAKATYADPTATVRNPSYQWHHPVGDVVSALIERGLVIEFLHEHPASPERLRPWMVQDADGWWRAPLDALPVLFSLRAVLDPPLAPPAIGYHSRAVVDRPDRAMASSGSPYESSIGFSRAVRIGNRVLLSGTAPIWPSGRCPEDVRQQARRCFQIIELALSELGAELGDVVRTRMFLTSATDADAVGQVHGEIFNQARPAATMIVVAALLDPRWKVEVEAEAAITRRAQVES
jgi:enamine deaminase RidA (YjgF/YER057c/UK114 family)/ubiquinone/menaquinone biosynthesis C-methylase UbiE